MAKKRQQLLVHDISNSLGKLPPQAIDVEEVVLGALMLESKAIINIASILREEHFYTEVHKEIYKAIIELFSEGSPTDMRSVVYRLRENGKLELVGGAMKIAELTSKVSMAANVEHHARILVEIAMKRSLIQIGSFMHQQAYEDTTDVFSLIEQSNLMMQDTLDNAISGKGEKTMREIALNNIKEVSARQSGKHTGLDSGYQAVDSVLNGWHKTDLVILAARPGMGKTAFAMQSGMMIAQRGIPVGVFSLEMSSSQLFERLCISESGIDSDKVRKGIMDEYEFKRFFAINGELSKLPLFIDDTPLMNIIELRARAMRMKAKHNVQLIIVDYLQLIKGINEEGKTMNRDQEIGLITRTLKGIAKELEIPIIALAQLSRAVEQRGGLKKPQLSDLRESGSIEQDADVVVFLYRPEYYKITEDSDGFPTHGLCEVIIAKHRNGPTDEVKIKFIGKMTKFVSWVGESTPTITERQRYAKEHYKNPTEEMKDQDYKNDDQPF